MADPLARGEMFGGAGVTEPQSDSDVAGMRTTYAKEADGGFVPRGSKTWISNLDIASFFVTFATTDPSLRRRGITACGAHYADYGMLLARTDPGQARHRGITCFALPMDRAGIDVRPIRQLDGESKFNEVFLDDVRVEPDEVLGEVGRGWTVALSILGRERRMLGSIAIGLATTLAAVRARAESAGLDDALFRDRWSRLGRPGPAAALDLVRLLSTSDTAGADSRTSVLKLTSSQLQQDVVAALGADVLGLDFAAGAAAGAERAASSPHTARRSPAAPPRCSARSSASGCWACRAEARRTRETVAPVPAPGLTGGARGRDRLLGQPLHRGRDQADVRGPQEVSDVVTWWGLKFEGKTTDEFVRYMDDAKVDAVMIPSARMASYQTRQLIWDVTEEQVTEVASAAPGRIHGLFGINPREGMDGGPPAGAVGEGRPVHRRAPAHVRLRHPGEPPEVLPTRTRSPRSTGCRSRTPPGTSSSPGRRAPSSSSAEPGGRVRRPVPAAARPGRVGGVSRLGGVGSSGGTVVVPRRRVVAGR